MVRADAHGRSALARDGEAGEEGPLLQLAKPLLPRPAIGTRDPDALCNFVKDPN